MERGDQLEENKWNLTSFFESRSKWRDKLNHLITESETGFSKIKYVDISKKADPDEIKTILDNYFDYVRHLEMVYTYAHLKRDEDVSNSENKEGCDRALSLFHQYMSASSWLEPTLLQMDKETFQDLIAIDELRGYRFYLTKLLLQKEHVLSKDKEQMLSLAQRMQSTPSGAFSAISNADFDYGSIKDGAGKEHKLTNASYGKFIKSCDRVLRANASNKLHNTFISFENTIAELLSGQVKNHVFNAEVRKYKSCLEAALKPNNIPVSVYENLIEKASSGLAPLHRYVSLRKKLLGLDKVESYDLYVPLVEMEEKKYSFEEACNIVVESVAILGKDYQDTLRKGLLEDGWADRYENKGKRSGAYSSGCYDSNPYMLLNFQGRLNDVLTLSHEAGHSMNSYLSNKKQLYHDADYTIFVAEVASTFNEQLTYEYIQNQLTKRKERIFLLCEQLDAIRTTFFRQAMFAEFELKIHQMAEKFVPLTAQVMKKLYGELCAKYYGEDFYVSEQVKSEYLRIPHFYANFYVYQYSTGIAAALTLVDKVKNGGLDSYMGFLEAGGSDFSTNILKNAGVDMTTSEPIEKTLEIFAQLLQKLEKEFEEKEKSI